MDVEEATSVILQATAAAEAASTRAAKAAHTAKRQLRLGPVGYDAIIRYLWSKIATTTEEPLEIGLPTRHGHGMSRPTNAETVSWTRVPAGGCRGSAQNGWDVELAERALITDSISAVVIGPHGKLKSRHRDKRLDPPARPPSDPPPNAVERLWDFVTEQRDPNGPDPHGHRHPRRAIIGTWLLLVGLVVSTVGSALAI